MPKIMRPSLVGTFNPAKAWPHDCSVQWGSSGVVFTGQSSYKTAFFEVFPKDGGFIRGEGATIAEAEKLAFIQFNKEIACNHRFGRKGYTNGGGFCYHCGAFRVEFKPIVELGEWKKPLDSFEASSAYLFADSKTNYGKKIRIKARRQGISLKDED